MTAPEETDRRELLKSAMRAVDDLRARLEASERGSAEPIAITGVGCRMPGGVETPEAFWALLAQGRDAIRDLPEGRWSDELYRMLAPELADGPRPRGGFLDRLDLFDSHFFNIAPREALTMDPQHRMVLETAWEALEHAGQAPDGLKGSLTGVFVGITAIDYAVQLCQSDPSHLDVYSATGSAHNAAAGRVSYTLGLQGPSMAVDTACSSSLAAVHLACQSLRLKESDMALAGGVNTLIMPEWFISLARWGMLAPDGRCKAFDAAADGMVRAEGCGIIVLKRLSDALAAGDRILAVLRGSAVNQDGPSSGLTVPNGPAQEAVVRQALRAARVKPSEVSYVEAHGTGTALGDPIELDALRAVLSEGRPGDQPLLVGSVKSNVGHLESAAGIAGLIKVILSLQHGAIPPNLHFHTMTPAITPGALAVTVPTAMTPWPAGERARIAGVSSFGLSGTNAHVIVEEAPAPASRPESSRPVHLLTITARSATALRAQAERWRHALSKHPELHPGDVAHTANTGRAAFSHRAALLAKSVDQFGDQLAAIAEGRSAPGVTSGVVRPKDRPRLAFLFTGQGSQYSGMAQDLYRSQPVFRAALDRCDTLLRPSLDRPLLSVIYPEGPQGDPAIDETAYTQPALFAVEYALAELWASWGIKPAALLGHSVGEYVAACLAGVFSLEDGLRLIAARGRLMQRLPAGGAMLAVTCGEDQVRALVLERWADLAIAAVNGPSSVVISGPQPSISAVADALRVQGIASQPLTVSHAFHSALMDPMLPAFLEIARTVAYSAPRLPLVSNVSGRPFEQGEVPDADYWTRHLRGAVRFADGVHALAAQGFRTFLEVGPAPTLSGLGRRTLQDPDMVFLASLRRGRPDWQEMLTSVGALFAAGAPINWHECDRGFDWTTVSLPTYPFERESYWIEPGGRKDLSASASPSSTGRREGRPEGEGHPLLGHRLRSASRDVQFERLVGPHDPDFLSDHVVHGRVVFPAAGYIEMILAAADALWGKSEHRIDDMVMVTALTLSADASIPVQTVVTPTTEGAASVRICSPAAGASAHHAWTVHVEANLHRAGAGAAVGQEDTLAAAQRRCTEPWAATELYDWYRVRGLQYGERFACLERLWKGDREAVGVVRWPETLGADAQAYRLHPSILDACMQTLAAALPGGGNAEPMAYLPVNVGQVFTYAPCGAISWSHVRLHAADDTSRVLVADVRLFDAEGRPVAEIRNLRARVVSAGSWEMSEPRSEQWLYEIQWRPDAVPTGPDRTVGGTGTWIIVAPGNAGGATLARRISARGGLALLVLTGGDASGSEEPWRQIAPDRPDEYDALCADVASLPDVRGFVHMTATPGLPKVSRDAADVLAASRGACGSLLHLAQALCRHGRGAQLVVVTRDAQAIASDAAVHPVHAAVWGLARAIRAERAELHCASVDLPGDDAGEDLEALSGMLVGGQYGDERALRAGRRFSPRIVPSGLRARPSADTGAARVLGISEKGLLDNLRVSSEPRRAPGPGEVEVEVKAGGLNFRDVLNALGMYPGQAGPLGGECAGTVVRAGTNVEDLRPGDEVVGMPAGAFRTYLTVPADSLVRKPGGLSMAAAATVPIAFLTARYGLTTLAGMRRGHRVLVHAGTGGVGLAAIQIAQQAGAEVFATAGNDEKRAYLRALGVAHVFSSRTLDFGEQVLEATGGAGVDIVLNSLAGEFITQSVRTLARGGRFVEIGKNGIWTAEQMAAVRPDVTYLPLYLGEVPAAITLPMLSDLLREVADGQLTPLPQRAFALDNAADAFRYMAQARHIGKIILTCGDAPPPVRADATYVVTGGFGALGSLVAGHLVAQGARHLILVGRRGASDREAAAALTALRSAGARVDVVQGDVADAATVAEVFRIAADGPPVRGIVHTAGIVEDRLLPEQSWEGAERVFRPKALGAWHLHEQSRHCPLDFFLLFSSSASVLPMPGQANYAAANAFLDGLAQYRRAEGLPAASINWGPWAGRGMAARVSEQDRQRWQRHGIGLISEEGGLEVFTRMLAGGPAQLCVLPVEWGAFIGSRAEGVVPSLLTDLSPRAEQQRAPSAPLPEQLENLPPSEQRRLIYDHVCDVVRRVLAVAPSFTLEPHQGLRDLGMDSLMAVELRNHLQRTVGQPLPSTLGFDFPAIESLTAYLSSLLTAGPAAVPATSGGNGSSETGGTGLDTDLYALSEEAAEALLAEELNR